MRDYQTLYDANFASTGGDPDLAKKMTDAQVKKHGESHQLTVVMK